MLPFHITIEQRNHITKSDHLTFVSPLLNAHAIHRSKVGVRIESRKLNPKSRDSGYVIDTVKYLFMRALTMLDNR